MKKLLAFICVSVMAFVFVSFHASAEAADTFDLNGKWKAIQEWDNGWESGKVPFTAEIVQKGTEIKMIFTNSKAVGELRGNMIYLKSNDVYIPDGTRLDYPAREYKISEDGKTMSSNFRYHWTALTGNNGPATMKVTMVRE